MKKITLITTLAAIALAVGCSKNTDSQVSTSDSSAQLFQPGSIAGTSVGLLGTKVLALTFDDGPVATVTGPLLDYLREQNVKASFFVLGRLAQNHSPLLTRMRDEGHVIGSHTWDHTGLIGLSINSWEPVMAQLLRTEAVIAPFTQTQRHKYFRAPGGSWCPEHAEHANRDARLRPYIGAVNWDIGGSSIMSGGVLRQAADHDCWHRGLSVAQCASGYLREIRRKQGGIVLMHDIDARTVQMFRMILPELQREGYRFVTLDEVRSLDQYATSTMSQYALGLGCARGAERRRAAGNSN